MKRPQISIYSFINEKGVPGPIGTAIILFAIATFFISIAMVCTVADMGSFNQPKNWPRLTKIGECQYIEVGTRGWRDYSITHYGQCNNPIHKK